MLRLNYGVHRYLSDLFIFTCGLHKRTAYYFSPSIFNVTYLMYLFPSINKRAYEYSYSNIQKKYAAHTFWSISYMHKFPCRGQRRRSNASTAKKLNFAHKLTSTNNTNISYNAINTKKQKNRK